jgi:hypothetical protein
MRFRRLLCLLPFFCGLCVAQNQDQDQNQDQNQSTNFSTGPQYLANFGSPLFLRPISTPSLSLGEAPPAPPESPSGPVAVVEVAPAPPLVPDLFRVYYGGPEEIAPEVSEPVSEIEISSANVPSELPASIVNVGVVEVLDAGSLRERGYGIDLGDAAAFWKTHKRQVPRVYTNADVDGLHRN